MSDLPGFYYDAEKRRYFRLLPGSNRNNPLTLDKIKVKECQGAGSSGAGNSKKKARPVHQALFHQQINGPQMDGSLNLQERIIKSKLDSMSEKEDASLDLLDFCGNKLSDVVCENFIGVPEKNAVYGVWHGSNGTSVYRLSVRDKIHGKPDPSQALAIDAEQSLINCFPPGNQVMDFAVTRGLDSEPDSVFCLTSHLKTNNKVSSSLGIQFIKQDERRSGCFGTGHSVRFEFPNVLYSCAGGRTLFAIGGDKQIRLFSPTSRHYTSPYSGFCDQNTLAVDDGKVTSLKLTEDNSKLLAGTNKGEFYVFDPKTTNKISFALFSRSIVYCHVLNSQNQAIVSGHDNSLSLIDLRSLKAPVLNYSGHVNNCKRIAVSTEENLDVLCSSGADGIVRQWSISTGRLLSQIQLSNKIKLESPAPQHSWFSSKWNGSSICEPVMLTAISDKLFVYR